MLKIFGALIALVGVLFIFDARNIVKKLFGFGDQNEATLGFKIIGFMLAVIGGFIIWFNL